MGGLGVAVPSGNGRVGWAERTNYNRTRQKMFIVVGDNSVVGRFGGHFGVLEREISGGRIQGGVVLESDDYAGSSGCIPKSGMAIENKLMASEMVVGCTNLGALSQLIPLKENESAYVNK